MRSLNSSRIWKQKSLTGQEEQTMASSDAPTREGSMGEWQARVEALHEKTRLSRLTLQVCLQRGLRDEKALFRYLYPRLDHLTHPNAIQDMERAVERLAQARQRGESIQIFGDYDVDGTTAAALFDWALPKFSLEVRVRQPDRFQEGYGLSIQAVDEAAEAGIQVLLAVDCGITSFDAAERARALGIDLIILDHHQVAEQGLPPALAIVNPQREDCSSGLRELCGCGLAFFLVMALRSYGRQQGWFSKDQEPNLKEHLDLVVIATAADQVPLIGANRILVRHGLEVLKKSSKPGIRALLEVSGIGSKANLSPGHLAFVLAPRLNASGRLQSASLAFELLASRDEKTAYEKARELEKLNEERMELQNQIWDQVRERVEKGFEQGWFENAIVVADREWHEGIIGIVASRVTETFHRPAVVISLREDLGKGSVRSFGNKNVLEALQRCSDQLKGFGGHHFAAGLKIEPSQIEAFARAFDQAIGESSSGEKDPPLMVEGECSLADLDFKTFHELESLAPFGPGNPEPVFIFKGQALSQRVLKERHLKFQLKQNQNTMEAIWFHGAENQTLLEELKQARDSEWAAVPELNRFRGRVTPTLRIKEWRRLEI